MNLITKERRSLRLYMLCNKIYNVDIIRNVRNTFR